MQALYHSITSLPLLGKPFIEATAPSPAGSTTATSLPLLGKPFIEAPPGAADADPPRLIASPSGEALH